MIRSASDLKALASTTIAVDVPIGTEPSALAEAGYEELKERRPPGLIRRFLATSRHLTGLAGGGLVAYVRDRPRSDRRGLKFRLLQLAALFVWPFVKRTLRREPFPVQLRRRLELLGPSYIKLGQVLSMREDLLPRAITEELKNLLDRLPAISFRRFLELVVEDLRRPLDEMFSWIDPVPTGSASIAQSHRATTLDGDSVILKVVKPGIAVTLRRDARLLTLFSFVLELFLARFQPRRIAQEFIDYTLRETDMRLEANNAETFAANFADLEDIAFPRIYRRLSGSRVLCMEFFDGCRPDSDEARQMAENERERIVELGATAIIRMLFRDGFFHADLHPGNLIILPGPRAAFIDLGMVGRLDEGLRRVLLYYYYCLVTGDSENAAKYLTSVATAGAKGDPAGFRREVVEVSRRWQMAANFNDFSLAQLILESIHLGGKYHMAFPVELTLMIKALVTFEAVGQLLQPSFDVAQASRSQVTGILIERFSPWRLAQESLQGAPELVDALVKLPVLITEGVKLLEQTTRRQSENPFAGIRGSIFGGFCLVAGAILVASGGPWPLWIVLFVIGAFASLSRGR